MSLISNGIDSVRAFALPAGIRVDGRPFKAPRMALVKWRSVLNDVYYQAYVNNRFAGTTLGTDQRQMVVPVPDSFTSAVRIEVFAVRPQYAGVDLSEELAETSSDTGRIKISMLRSHDLPPDSTIQIYCDNGTSEIDYDVPLNDSPIRIWPAWQDKAGFGMSRFGVSDFGYDSAAAVGFGKGSFGNDRFGLDADTIEWISPPLNVGVYKFAVVVTDSKGNQSSAGETGAITVTPAAQPAEKLEISSYDKQTNKLVLKIT
jgi:hypothetical protein